MAGRFLPIHAPVTLTLDGERIVAERGEPIAAALIAANKHSFARSTKFHRPRGPSCMRGACDGCLARVDGIPNVMTCMVPAREGTRVEVQNTLGSGGIDLLRVTDWFFPKGMDHHHLLAGVPGVQRVMQAFARRVAGLGHIPETGATATRRTAARRELDVVVVGAGPAGMAVASLLHGRGRAVEILDDGLEVGQSLRALGRGASPAWCRIEAEFERAVGTGLVVRTSTTAAGVFGDDLLVAGADGTEVVSARAVVFATGGHDGVLAFEGNDVPGVASARAAGILLQRGILVGRRIVVVVSEGGGPFGEAFARAAEAAKAPCEIVVVQGEPVRVTGSSRVRSVVVLHDGRPQRYQADALLVDAPRAPAYELPEQAGATVVHERRGFIARTEEGKIRDGFWVLGEAAGSPFDAEVIDREASAVATQIANYSSTSAPKSASPPSTEMRSNVPRSNR